MPSGFYLTDAIIWLDKLLGWGLLVPSPEADKPALAAKEAKRIKKLLGALRHLFRNSYSVLKPLMNIFVCFDPTAKCEVTHFSMVCYKAFVERMFWVFLVGILGEIGQDENVTKLKGLLQRSPQRTHEDTPFSVKLLEFFGLRLTSKKWCVFGVTWVLFVRCRGYNLFKLGAGQWK